jgi:LPXTG-motif cell wall-anchored protein
MNDADLGTRWVLLAALGGLIMGGVVAYWRKKRDRDKAPSGEPHDERAKEGDGPPK